MRKKKERKKHRDNDTGTSSMIRTVTYRRLMMNYLIHVVILICAFFDQASLN
jgi:hypothetical protein